MKISIYATSQAPSSEIFELKFSSFAGTLLIASVVVIDALELCRLGGAFVLGLGGFFLSVVYVEVLDSACISATGGDRTGFSCILSKSFGECSGTSPLEFLSTFAAERSGRGGASFLEGALIFLGGSSGAILSEDFDSADLRIL